MDKEATPTREATSIELQSIYQRLSDVQEVLKAPKGQNNTFGGYKYRSCEDILEAVKPILKSQGLVLILSDRVSQVGDRYYVTAEAVLSTSDGSDNITVTAHAREEETKKGMDASQITGAASSYARKYALNGLFNIDDTKDADTDEHNRQTDGNQSGGKPAKLSASKTANHPDSTTPPSANAQQPAGHWATCEILGCTRKIKPEKVEVNKKYHDGHSICYEHSTDMETPWHSLLDQERSGKDPFNLEEAA